MAKLAAAIPEIVTERLGRHCEGGSMRDDWRVGERYPSAMLCARITTDAEPTRVSAARPARTTPTRSSPKARP